MARGLDPNEPADALLDFDQDGLSTIDDFLLGLDPFDPDSDDDGLVDGEEVNEVGTDPLLFDTDGDQVSDGLEIVAGSDPRNRLSVNLAPVLAALEVSPATFTITYNTVLGEGSRRLTVTATLIDGTVLDATGAPYGTTYSSSDLTVASFGAEPERVFAGADGTATVTAANGSFSATAAVTVETFAPTALAFVPIPGFPNAVDVSGSYAYVAAGGRGLYVVDVSDPAAAFIAGGVDPPGNANDVRVIGDFAYLANGTDGLRVLDVSDPSAPLPAARLPVAVGQASAVAVADGRAYLAVGETGPGSSGLQVVDVSDPFAPVALGSVSTPGNARGVALAGNLALVADGNGLQVVDVGDPAQPVIIGSASRRAADVAVRGRRAYVPGGTGSYTLGGLRVFDVGDGATPVAVGATDERFGLSAVALERDLALTADYFFVNAVPIFDVSADVPIFVAALDFSGAPSFRDDNGTDVAARDGLVFMTGVRDVITDNGTYGDGGLHVGRYLVLEDGEAVPPAVALTAPADGDAVRERRLLTVAAAASDDVKVARVEFLVDGEVVANDFSAPYEHTLRVPSGAASLRLGARAVDLGGNVGTAEEITVTVLSDAAPTVDLLSPREGVDVVEGTLLTVAAEATDDVAVTSVELRVEGLAAATVSAPPYRLDVAVPLGTASLTVSATATDDAGQTAVAGPLLLPVADDPAPAVAILEPADGAAVVAGSFLSVVVAAADEGPIERVRLVADGELVGERVEEPYAFLVAAPAEGGEIVLTAIASDELGQETAATIRVDGGPDPGTTVFGSVVTDQGAAAPGAEVDCGVVAGTAGAEGFFTLPGAPSLDDVRCTASFVDAAGGRSIGTSEAVAPVPGGVTDVGEITLVGSSWVEDFGSSLAISGGGSVAITPPFEFPFYGERYAAVYVNGNGNLTFLNPSRDGEEDRDEFASGFRRSDHLNVGPSIAAFWDRFTGGYYTRFGEHDLYRFSGLAGQRVDAEVNAARSGSALDPVLWLYQAPGLLLAVNDDYFGLDSHFVETLPADGEYFFQVEDYQRSGGPNHFYTLTVRLSGGPVLRQVNEAEPNDTFLTATPVMYGDRASGVIAEGTFATRQVYVNDALPGRLVVTWYQMYEYPEYYGFNTIQASLFDDGKIVLIYDGLTSDDAIVGLSPANGLLEEVDFSAAAPLATSGAAGIFEQFAGPDDTDGDGLPGTRPFDLDGRTLTFVPNASGGYDVSVQER